VFFLLAKPRGFMQEAIACCSQLANPPASLLIASIAAS